MNDQFLQYFLCIIFFSNYYFAMCSNIMTNTNGLAITLTTLKFSFNVSFSHSIVCAITAKKTNKKISFGFGVSNKIYGSTEIGEKGGGGRSAIEMLNQSTICSHYSEMISSLSFADA